jgi:hypothetical protein
MEARVQSLARETPGGPYCRHRPNQQEKHK